MSNNNTTTVSFPIAGILGVAFIVLKLCHVIAWSWLWVLSPFWIPVAIGLFILALLVAAVIIVKLVKLI